MEDSKVYLELSPDPVRFEPVSKVTNVFFDDTNKEVLSVRGGGTLGVVIKGDNGSRTFCMDNRGTISSLKFSPDHFLLALQRTSNSVELLSYSDGNIGQGTVQETKTKGAVLLGFIWTHVEDLVLVTDHGIEFYQVSKEKMTVKLLRSCNQSCTWFIWSPECSLLLLCAGTGTTSATLQPFSFSPGQLIKNSKFEVEVNNTVGGQTNPALLGERDICVGTIYSITSVCILRHPASPTMAAHLDIYSQNKDGIFKRTHICRLEITGKFAVNIIDSIIIVHHQASKTSLLFDISLGGEVSGGITSVFPITLPRSIGPFSLEEPISVPSPVNTTSNPCELYAPTWVVFQPDIIIDARLGCMWHLKLKLSVLPSIVDDKCQLVDCLLRRNQAKSLVLSVVRQVIETGVLAPLGQIFDKINTVYWQHLNSILQSQMGECVNSGNQSNCDKTLLGCVIIEQADMYSSVLAPLMELADVTHEPHSNTQANSEKPKNVVSTQLMVGVIVEYIRSLGASGITVQHFLYELVINALVRTKQFYQLHQLLQYHVPADSKPLACLLLSLVGVYSAGQQLSLDMLCRLNTAHDEIIEVLLSHNLVTPALRYARKVGLSESISARKFLEAAITSDDEQVFYSTYTFFALRNANLRGNAAFVKGEHCDVYVNHYKKLFGDPPDYAIPQS